MDTSLNPLKALGAYLANAYAVSVVGLSDAASNLWRSDWLNWTGTDATAMVTQINASDLQNPT